MLQALQWLGGVFYLLNKLFLAFAERAMQHGNDRANRRWRIYSWVAYLFGLPPWVILFALKRDWIAASVETSGLPAMMLGLVLALKGRKAKTPRWLDWLAKAAIMGGFAYSLWDFGGLKTWSQLVEIGLVLGFLVGTYLIALEKASGYLWYVLMHVACGYLMLIQDLPWLFAQQLLSLVFIADAFITTQRQKRGK